MPRHALAAVLAVVAAGPLQALSCLPPDVASAYRMASDSEDRYIAVLGRAIFDSAALTPDRGRIDPRSKSTIGRFDGESFTLDGARRPYGAEIEVVAECWASWCGQPVSGRPFVGFLRMEDSRPVLSADPCGTMIFYDPAPEDIARLSDCMAGGPCEPVAY